MVEPGAHSRRSSIIRVHFVEGRSGLVHDDDVRALQQHARSVTILIDDLIAGGGAVARTAGQRGSRRIEEDALVAAKA